MKAGYSRSGPSPRRGLQQRLPSPPRPLSALVAGGWGGALSGRQVWSHLNVSDLPIAPHESTHSPSSTQAQQPAVSERSSASQSLSLRFDRGSQQSLCPREGLLLSRFWLTSVLLPPGCRCDTRTDTDVCAVPNRITFEIWGVCVFFFPLFLYILASPRLENGQTVRPLKTLPPPRRHNRGT